MLDALTTLAFDYPKRAAFFRDELEHYLLLGREQRSDLLSIKGSYAGAIGVPQFMPSSYRRYAVDFDNDGKVDLVRQHGGCDWQRRQLPEGLRLGSRARIVASALVNGENYRRGNLYRGKTAHIPWRE